MESLSIEISIENPEREMFAEFLSEKGHTVKIGRSTGNYVNGCWTSSDAEANEIYSDLWARYCNQEQKI